MANGFEAVSEALAAAVEGSAGALVRVVGRCGGATGVVWSADQQSALVVVEHQSLGRSRDSTPPPAERAAVRRVELTLSDGRTSEAELVGRDPGTNLALLRLNEAGMTAAKWGSLDAAKVGHLVLALARPGKTVRARLGVLSAIGDGFRTWSGGRIERYVQTDVELAAGFGGALVVNHRGEGLGVATSGLMRGSTLVVPVETVRRVVNELSNHGKVRRGYLGVGVQPARLHGDAEKEAGQSIGALVAALEPGSPAEEGGILVGDVLLSLDGHGTEHPRDLAVFLQDKVGVQVTAKVLRAGRVLDVTLTTRDRP